MQKPWQRCATIHEIGASMNWLRWRLFMGSKYAMMVAVTMYFLILLFYKRFAFQHIGLSNPSMYASCWH